MNCQLSLLSLIRTPVEDDVISGFLQRSFEFADEIIVVSLAAEKKKEIWEEKWGIKWVYGSEQSISDALNEGLKQARGFWILRLDPDEEIVDEEKYQIQMLVNRMNQEGFYFLNPNHSDRYGLFFELRLFRNRLHYRYQGRTISRLPLELEKIAELTDLKVIQNRKLDPGFVAAILDGLKNEAQHYSLDPLYSFHLSAWLAKSGFLEEAEQIWRLLILREQLPKRYNALLYKWRAQYLEDNHKLTEALDCIAEGLRKHPKYMDLHFLKGKILFQQAEFEAAREIFQQCIHMEIQAGEYAHEPGIGDFKSWFSLAQISEALGDIGEAIRQYEKSYETNGGFTEPLYRIAGLIHRQQGENAVQGVLEKWLSPNQGDHLQLLADIFYKEHLYGKAKEYAEKAYQLFPQKDETIFLLANCLLMSSEPEDAIFYFAKIPEQSPLYLSALRRACQGSWLLEDWAQAEHYLHLLEKQDGSPLFHLYRSVHQVLSGESFLSFSMGDNQEMVDHLSWIVNRFLALKKDPLAERLLPLMEQNTYFYSYAGKLFYFHKRFALADHFLNLALQQGESSEQIAALLVESKREQKRDYEAAQFLHRELGKAIVSSRNYLQYAGILIDWACEVARLGKQRYPTDEKMNLFYKTVKEIPL